MAAEHFLNERVSGALLSQNVSEVWKGNKHGNHRVLVLERGLVISLPKLKEFFNAKNALKTHVFALKTSCDFNAKNAFLTCKR